MGLGLCPPASERLVFETLLVEGVRNCGRVSGIKTSIAYCGRGVLPIASASFQPQAIDE